MAKYININGKEYPVYATAEEADEYFAAFFNSGWDAISDEDVIASFPNQICYTRCKITC